MVATNDDSIIQLRAVSKLYATPAGPYAVIRGATLDVAPGEFLALFGPSGSGKSTLLSLIAGIERATAGEILAAGARVNALDESGLARWRGRKLGIVFQFFQLMPSLTAVENVMLPMDLGAVWPARERRPRAEALLEQLGVADQRDKMPATLSGGQQQRVAIARALANDPAIVLADEPTGNLDSRTGTAILDLFAGLAGTGRCIVMATHDQRVTSIASTIAHVTDGVLHRAGEAARA